ncbi:MAG: hypothetical protein ACJ790_19030 [Myxococcaceae bacterium]
MNVRGAGVWLFALSTMAAAAPSSQLKLAAPGLQPVQVDEKIVDFYNDYFAEQLREQAHAQVTTKSEVGAIIGFERQKQLLGCSDGSQSCLAEMAGALGVDGIVSGSLAKLGSAYTIQIKILKASDGTVLFAQSARLATDDEVHDWLKAQAKTFGAQASKDQSGALVVEQNRPSSGGLRQWAWAPGVVGVASAGLSVVFYLQSKASAASIKDSSSPIRSDYNKFVTAGQTQQTLAAVFAGAAVAGLTTAGVMYALGGGESSATVSLVPSAHGAIAAVEVKFP